jgi:hypothetical protein
MKKGDPAALDQLINQVKEEAGEEDGQLWAFQRVINEN